MLKYVQRRFSSVSVINFKHIIAIWVVTEMY